MRRQTMSELNAEQRALLDRLGDGSYGAHGNTIEDATCLEGTRQKILQRIDEWIQDESSQRVLWIYGMAGRGKSTIAATVPHRWRDRSAWALFHFRRGQTALEKRLICALAKQLESRAISEVRHAILQAVQKKKDIAQGRLDEQFEVLLVNPLKDYPPQSPPILLIVDALDECEDVDYATGFIELIDKHSSSLPHNIKFILTTRPENPLLRTLRSQEWRMEDLDHIMETHDDVKLFIQSGFLKIRKVNKGLPVNWPTPESVEDLVTMSNGLFQWAKTALKHISGSPERRFRELLKNPSGFCDLDGLYQQILSSALQKATKNSGILCRTLAILVATPYPVSLEVIAYLLAGQEILWDKVQMDDFCNFMRDDVLPDVVSLIDIPASTVEPIQIMHTSIRDLLMDAERCGRSSYFVNRAQAHWDLARDCFRLMERDLKKNICDLSDLSKPNSAPDVQDCVVSRVPSGLKYCCRSWTIHLTTPKEPDQDNGKPRVIMMLNNFSKTNLLCWVEVMSLIGRVGEAIIMAKQVEDWTKVSCSPK